MNYLEISKDTIGNLYKSYNSLKHSPLDPQIICLVEILVSKLNGCQYCIQVHSKQALKLGVKQFKIAQIESAQVSDEYTAQEKAALSWASQLTLLESKIRQYDEELEKHFSQREIVDLTACISLMNALNRIAMSLRGKDNE